MKFLYFILIFLYSLTFSWEHDFGLSFRHNDPVSVIDVRTVNAWWARGDFKTSKDFNDWSFRFNTSVQYEDNGLFLFSLKELSISKKINKLDLSFGRFPLEWSSTDASWGLGKINNRENFDFFHPGQEGLAGLNARYNLSSNLSLDIFGSFFYIPELNPPLNINKSERTIDSNSPWADAPDRTAEVGSSGTVFDLLYDVNVPEIMDIIFKPTYGLSLNFNNDFISTNFFYIRKPENKLTNKAEVSIPSSSTTTAVVSIDPLEFKHHVFGGEFNYHLHDHFNPYIGYISSLADDKPSDDFEIVSKNIGVGITVERNDESYLSVGSRGEIKSFKYHLGYLSRVSDFSKTNILTGLPRWDQVLNFSISGNFTEKISFAGDVKYDFGSKDRVYYFGASYLIKPYLSTSLGAQIIGSPQNGDGYWANYRQNDSVFAEVKLSL